MTTGQVVGLVVGIVIAVLVMQLLIWIPVIRWLRKKNARMVAQLGEEVAALGERPLMGPGPGLFGGGTGTFPFVSGNGVGVLTDRRFVFRLFVGKDVDIAMDRVAGVREAKWFRSKYRGGRLFLIVQTRDGSEAGFIFPDHAAWMSAMRALVPEIAQATAS